MTKRPMVFSLFLPMKETADLLPAGFWSQAGGPLLTLSTIFVLDLLSPTVFRIPNPAAILLLLVVFSAFTGGLRPGLASAVLTWVYLAFFYSIPGRPFDYAHDDLRRVIVWGVTTPAMALLVGD